jgi:hypothetical protein
MMKRSSYLQLGVLGIVALGGAATIGFCESRWGSTLSDRSQSASSLSDKQALERRRGRMAVVAIAGTTTR